MIELKVTGMSCQHCVQAVKDALAGVIGVTGVEQVELESGRALVEGNASPEALVAAVKAAGYDAEPIVG